MTTTDTVAADDESANKPLDLADLLDAHIRETVALRMGARMPGPATTAADVLECLLDVRQRLDRVEELLGSAVRLRAAAHRALTACRIQSEDAWDEAAVRLRSAAQRDEYASARERAAATNLEVVDLRRAERKAEARAKLCDEAVDFLRLRHTGLAQHRQDLLSVVRALQFESSLDR